MQTSFSSGLGRGDFGDPEPIRETSLCHKKSRLTHAHLDEHVKENVKDMLGMRTVPFYVVVDKVKRSSSPLQYAEVASYPLITVVYR